MIAAIYARKSTEQNGVADEAKSVRRQIEHAREFAARKGWAVAEDCIFVDDGISGAEFENRPEYQRLMAAVARKPRPPFQVLIVSEVSRLGREMFETNYALKRLATAGVSLWSYLEDREIEISSPVAKVMQSLKSFVDESERDRASQRTYDALQRKARAGYVTGGRVFGYDNVCSACHRSIPPRGRRCCLDGHTERQVNEHEAAVVRKIFDLAALGFGRAAIAKKLNDEGRPHPRPQQGRPGGWCPSSIREVLYRELYRGVIVWNKTKKRPQRAFGQVKPTARPDAEWLRVDAPHLRIVSDAQWAAAHERIASTRATYLRTAAGRLWGRPVNGTAAKYLGTGLLQCGCCGATLEVRTRAHGKRATGLRRVTFYACSSYWRKGTAICRNASEVRMAAADRLILDLVESTLLHPAVLELAIQKTLNKLRGHGRAADAKRADLMAAITAIDAELLRLTSAIAAGGDLPAILQAIGQRESRKAALVMELNALGQQHVEIRYDPATVKATIAKLLADWRTTIRKHVPQARSMLRKLLRGRLTVTPETQDGVPGFRFRGEGTIRAVLAGWFPDFPQAVASPTGFEPVFWP